MNGTAIAVGAVLGLAAGIVISVATDLPFAPEGGLVLGALLGGALAPQKVGAAPRTVGEAANR